jgi:M6 family metalloprotease-like protein
MKKHSLQIAMIALFLTCFNANHLVAIPAFPHPIEYRLPDGSTLTILLKGDEKVHWAQTMDGYSLLLNPDGYYEYAIKAEDKSMICSGIRAHNVSKRNIEETIFLTKTTKDLRYNVEQIQIMKSIWEIQEVSMEKLRSEGGTRMLNEVRFPLILVGFQDKPFTLNAEAFKTLMNQPNYTAGNLTGSVYDYFYKNSYEKLQITVDVYGPYTVSKNIGAYDNKTSGDPRKMALEAAKAAYADGCDFSLYDLDNNGRVEGFHIIFAGYGQEAGAPAGKSIWSHSSSVYWSTNEQFNGKRLDSYSCSPEYRGNSGTAMTHIGVIAHELSHVFGLPDFYDTDYEGSGGTAVDTGPWDIMANGSWNDNGRTPAGHNPWSKIELGWITPIVLETPCNVTIPNPAITGAAYIIETDKNNEYFLLENRQKTGWDAYIPSSGMLIYHVNLNHSGWKNNCVNCKPSDRGFYIKQAGCNVSSDCLNNRPDIPYPSSGKTAFTDETIPNSLSWAGHETGKPVTNIVHNTSDRTITFSFMSGQDIEFNVIANPYVSNTGTVIGAGSFEIAQEVTVSATAAEGFCFKYWTNSDGTIVSDSPDYTFTIYSDVTLYAHFHSMDATLMNIVVRNAVNMTPEFNPQHLQYDVFVPENTSSIKITGFVNHASATVKGNGTFNLNDSVNHFQLTVTAEDKQTTKVYELSIIKTSGIDEYGNNPLVYPNPTSGIVHIEITKPVTAIQLMDVQGRTLQHFNNIHAGQMEINLSSYPQGIYFLSVDGKVSKLMLCK